MKGVLLNVDVGDLGAAIDFYARAFELRLSRRLFGGTVAEMTGGPLPLYLLARAAGSPPFAGATTARREYEPHWTPVHFDVVVDEIVSAIERAEAAGATLEGDVQRAGWGTLATMRDPFGHGFCLIELRGLGYDDPSAR